MARMNMSYRDLFKPPETRTADEIKEDIKEGINALRG